jgi:hypothetical protein
MTAGAAHRNICRNSLENDNQVQRTGTFVENSLENDNQVQRTGIFVENSKFIRDDSRCSAPQHL